MMNYFDIPAVSATAIKAGARSMLHMHAVMTEGSKADSSTMRWGRLIHAAILESARFASNARIYDGIKRGKDWDAFRALSPDEDMILKTDEFDYLMAIKRAVIANHHAAQLIIGAKTEVVLQWSGDYGDAKAKLDGIAADGALFDVKTMTDIRPDRFARQFVSLGYDLQCGWYIEAAVNSTGAGDDTPFYIIGIESDPPHDVAVYRVPRMAIEIGRKRARDIARRYRQCEAVGRFPGVQEGVKELVLPEWYGADDVSIAFAEMAARDL